MQKKTKLKKNQCTRNEKKQKKHKQCKTSLFGPKVQTQNKQQAQNNRKCGLRPQTATAKNINQNRANFDC